MPKEEWGVKRICPSCATRFYDLQNDPVTCPSCAASFPLATLVSGKAKASMADKEDQASKKATKEVVEDAEVLEDEPIEDDTSDVDIDDDLLEEDDDDTIDLEEIADVPLDDDES